MNEFAKGFVWQMPAIVEDVIDGDTPVCKVAYSADDIRDAVRVRIEGINCEERGTKYGDEATAFLRTLLPVGTIVTLVHHKHEARGRLLAKIIMQDGRDVGMIMLTTLSSDGVTPLAKPYML